MQRSTRVRRMLVALLVVLALAVAVRFARASDAQAAQGAPVMTLPGHPPEFDAPDASRPTMRLLHE